MRQSLILSRNPDNSILSQQDIMQRAPAVFSNTKASHLSDKYEALYTADLLPIMADYGFHPTQAAQVKSKKGLPEHKNHLVAFAKADTLALPVRPEIVLFNSHNGSGAVRLFAGAYRMICSNGIVSGHGVQSRMYHSKRQLAGFEEMLKSIVEGLPWFMEKLESLRAVEMTRESAYLLAESAAQLRWKKVTPEATGPCYDSLTVQELLCVRREEDNLKDAFTVWNRIQENVLRGNAMIRSVTNTPEGRKDTLRKARPVNSVKEHVRINEALFNLI